MNKANTSLVLRLALTGALIGISATASAQDYPSKTIRMVIPYTPGGSIDTVGRLVADQLQRQLGQPIVIENTPGASGLLGSMHVKNAKADGYTLLFNASSQAYLPLVVAKKTYDPQRDFTPVAQIGYVPLIVAVNNGVQAKTIEEFIKLAKANPGKFTWQLPAWVRPVT